MPGMSMGGGGGRCPQGLVWNAELGGCVNANSTDPRTGRSYGSGNTQPGGSGYFRPNAQGQVTWSPNTTTNAANAPTPGGYGSGGGGGGGGTDDFWERQRQNQNPAAPRIEELIEQIRNTQPPAPPELPPIVEATPEPYNPAAERAAYGRAKERTGLATQSAMRSLRESMGQRGISGSGIEAEETGKLTRAGLGELADTDRALAEGQSMRSYEAEQARISRLINQYQFNAQLSSNNRMQVPNWNLSRWSLLSQLMGG